MSKKDLDAARKRIEELDAKIIALAAQRIEAAREAGRAKHALGLPTVDFQREAKVLERVRSAARAAGLPEAVAEATLQPLMLAAVSQQESDRVVAASTGKGQSAVVVGGAGRMGGWLVRFLADAGFATQVIDPVADAAANDAGRKALPKADLVLVAIPPGAIATLYAEWAKSPPKGIIADVASIKAPFTDALRRLAKTGAAVASFHPMFGPSLTSLRDADVVLCRTGNARAEAAIRSLFAPTTARVVELDLEEHDRAMAESLALAHAGAIAYAAARTGASPVRSVTQRRLASVADDVVRESPLVYYEIQAGNPHAPAAIERLQHQLHRLATAVKRKDPQAFADVMGDGRANAEAKA